MGESDFPHGQTPSPGHPAIWKFVERHGRPPEEQAKGPTLGILTANPAMARTPPLGLSIVTGQHGGQHVDRLDGPSMFQASRIGPTPYPTNETCTVALDGASRSQASNPPSTNSPRARPAQLPSGHAARWIRRPTGAIVAFRAGPNCLYNMATRPSNTPPFSRHHPASSSFTL